MRLGELENSDMPPPTAVALSFDDQALMDPPCSGATTVRPLVVALMRRSRQHLPDCALPTMSWAVSMFYIG